MNAVAAAVSMVIMKDPAQLAAEAARKWFAEFEPPGDTPGEATLTSIIQSCIEKARQQWDDEEAGGVGEQRRANRAAHASEQGADVWYPVSKSPTSEDFDPTGVILYTYECSGTWYSVVVGESLWNQSPRTNGYWSRIMPPTQRPTPATASEDLGGTEGISEATRESAVNAACFPATTENKTKQVQVLPSRKPDSATASEGIELSLPIDLSDPKQASEVERRLTHKPDSASVGKDWPEGYDLTSFLHGDDPKGETLEQLREANDNLFKIARKYCIENKQLRSAATPSGGGQDAEKAAVLAYEAIQDGTDDRPTLEILIEHFRKFATQQPRDCGEDTKRLWIEPHNCWSATQPHQIASSRSATIHFQREPNCIEVRIVKDESYDAMKSQTGKV